MKKCHGIAVSASACGPMDPGLKPTKVHFLNNEFANLQINIVPQLSEALNDKINTTWLD